MYIRQQLGDGVDPGTIINRVKTLRDHGVPLAPSEILRAKDRVIVNICMRTLKRLKNRKGTKHKALFPLSALRAVYLKQMHDPRDKMFQCVWYLLVVSGQRVANLVGAKFTLEPEGVRIVFAEGRKTDTEAWRAGILFPYQWTEKPPTSLLAHMQGTFDCPPIGKHKNIASNLNSWLKKKTFDFTTGVPRVHLDNVLRRLHRLGLIGTEEFVRVMDHTLETSDKYYLVA